MLSPFVSRSSTASKFLIAALWGALLGGTVLRAGEGPSTISREHQRVAAIQRAVENELEIKLVVVAGGVKVFPLNGDSQKGEIVLLERKMIAGDSIESLKDCKSLLVYGDGTEFKVKPETRIEIRPNGLRLTRGQVWFHVTKRGAQFEIETPTMIAGIRGTKFDIKVDPQLSDSELRVYDGKVAVISAEVESPEVMVEGGKATQVLKNSKPMAPAEFDMSAASAEWDQTLWTVSDKSETERAYESFLSIMRDPELVPLAPDAYNSYKAVEVEYKKRLETEGTH